MKSKMIATSTYWIRPANQKYTKNRASHTNNQHGATLIELMIGITIGLLTVTVAMGALMVSRGVSGTVSDASQLQQQSAFAFRFIGLQLRQAGSLYLNLAPKKTTTEIINISDPVSFETVTVGFDPKFNTIHGIDEPSANEYKLKIGYRNYKDLLYSSSSAQSLQRNCVGENNSDTLIESKFYLDTTKNILYCKGEAASPQPFLENVANFQVRYLIQDLTILNIPKIQYANASTVGEEWGRVQAAEVCIVLYGTEPIDMPAGSSYIDCDGKSTIDMTKLTGTRAKRMHMIFKNVYQLRSQGLI